MAQSFAFGNCFRCWYGSSHPGDPYQLVLHMFGLNPVREFYADFNLFFANRQAWSTVRRGNQATRQREALSTGKRQLSMRELNLHGLSETRLVFLDKVKRAMVNGCFNKYLNLLNSSTIRGIERIPSLRSAGENAR